ncbi:RelA/SpoT domain-containing protein [Candidatus Woesearchaeota archaeon]|nr:RelA/SpoT domain-containing protein [Candidatus Woesearchaeota archaeon]
MRLLDPKKHSKSQVDKAGNILSKGQLTELEQNEALEILSHWRGIHSYPLHIFKKTLKNYSESLDKKAVTVQRLKRVPSIVKKLNRKYNSQEGGIKLSRMQDIAGCRAIVKSMKEVTQLKEKYLNSKLRHELVKEYDYVTYPKKDGYRSIHLVYKYKSDRERKEYNGLNIEVQIRSQLQHIWATAVETTSFFIGQALKLSEGEEKWTKFFKLVSSAFARMENCPLVPDTFLNEKELYLQIKKQEKELNIITRMKKWNESLRQFEDLKSEKQKEFFVLELDTVQEKITITSFSKREEEKAIKMYADVERKIYGKKEYDVVLVGADNLIELKKAYPNYFADTKEFIKLLNKILEKVIV